MKFLVTGAAGFIASCLIWKLNDNGIEKIIATDTAVRLAGDCKNLQNKRFQDYIGSDRLLEYIDNGKLKESVDIIIHFGACADTTERDKDYLNANNFEYSRKLAEWAYRNSKAFLYASSAAVYGAGEQGYSDGDRLAPKLKPLNEYGSSKQRFDKWVVEKNLQKDFVGFRFFNVFGPNEYHKGEMRSMVNKGYHQIKNTAKIRLFKSYKPEYKDGEQKRDFIYVKDAVCVVWYFLQHLDKKGIFNVGSGNARSWNELANALFKALDMKPDIEYIDMPEGLIEQYQYFTQADLKKLKGAGYPCRFAHFEDAVKDYVGYLEMNEYL